MLAADDVVEFPLEDDSELAALEVVEDAALEVVLEAAEDVVDAAEDVVEADVVDVTEEVEVEVEEPKPLQSLLRIALCRFLCASLRALCIAL